MNNKYDMHNMHNITTCITLQINFKFEQPTEHAQRAQHYKLVLIWTTQTICTTSQFDTNLDNLHSMNNKHNIHTITMCTTCTISQFGSKFGQLTQHKKTSTTYTSHTVHNMHNIIIWL